MAVSWLTRLVRDGLSYSGWRRRLGYRWQPPTPIQPLAYDPFVIRLCPPTTIHHEQTRSLPYILRGRNEEMTEIACRLFRPNGPLSVIEGLPGIGKTTLLEAIGHYAENQGFAWVRLSRLDLCNLKRFDKALLRVNPAGEPTGSFALGLRNRLRVSTSTESDREQVSEAVRGDPHTIVYQALRRRVHARGILITIDDGRGLFHSLPENSPERLMVSRVLSTLNENLRVRGEALPVQAIIGGISGTIDEVQQAIGKRLNDGHVVVLSNIPTSAVCATIEDCLRTTEPDTGLAPASFPTEFILECAERCRGHPLLATAIGRTLQAIGIELAKTNRPQATPADLDRARQMITGRMESSYRTRSRNITRRDAEVMLDLARATTRWGPRLSYRAVEQLVQESGRRATEKIPAQADEHQPSSWLEHLRNEGLVVTYVATERYPRIQHTVTGAAYAEIDLPSFATFLTKHQNKANGMLSPEELAELVPPDERNLPAWDWPEAGEWHPIEQPAPPPPGNPYALEPTVPGDLPDPARPRTWTTTA